MNISGSGGAPTVVWALAGEVGQNHDELAIAVKNHERQYRFIPDLNMLRSRYRLLQWIGLLCVTVFA
jgi:hypothetical protein